jgi:hypothetical protein
MNKKLIGILVCMLLIAIVVPTSGSMLVPSKYSEPIIISVNENSPPIAPEVVDGPYYGKPNVLHKFTIFSEDPEGDDIYYFIDWRDGDYEFWDGPYASGEEVTYGHVWLEGGDYTIRIIAKDGEGAKSDETKYDMKILIRSRTISNPILFRLLERFPILRLLVS